MTKPQRREPTQGHAHQRQQRAEERGDWALTNHALGTARGALRNRAPGLLQGVGPNTIGWGSQSYFNLSSEEACDLVLQSQAGEAPDSQDSESAGKASPNSQEVSTFKIAP